MSTWIPSVERLYPSDASGAAVLISTCFGEQCRDEFLRDFRALSDADRQGAAWGIWAEDRLVAYLAWVDVDPVGSDLFTLQWGCVHPEWRHRRLLHEIAARVLVDIGTSIERDGLILTKTWPVKPLLKMGFTKVPGYKAESRKVLLTKPVERVKLNAGPIRPFDISFG